MRSPRSPAPLVLAALLLAAASLAAVGGAQPSLDGPPENGDVARELAALAEAHPGLVRVFSIGESVEGRPLWTAHVTDPHANGSKLQVYLDGGHHGDELLGTVLALQFLRHVVDGWAQGDPFARRLLAEHDLYVTPMVNPDGAAAGERKNARGVDLNRNYPFEWGAPGASADPAAHDYRGPRPLSEPESRAVAAFAAAHGLDLWVTMHSGITELYWPWGYTRAPPPDAALFRAMEAPFEAAAGGRVDAKQASELYVASGSVDDYGYGALGVPTFTYEVHEAQGGSGFYRVKSPEALLADQLAGLLWLVAHADRLGASVHVHDPAHSAAPDARWVAGGLVVGLHNAGWGAANVSLSLESADGVVLANRSVALAPGQNRTVAFPGVAGAGDVVVRGAYRELAVNASEVRALTRAVEAP